MSAVPGADAVVREDLDSRVGALLASDGDGTKGGRSRANPEVPTALEEELRIAQSLHLVGQLPALVIANFGGACVAFLAVLGYADWRVLSAWLALIWLLCVPMAVNWARLRNRPAPERVSHRRIRRARVHSLALGIGWALLMPLLAWTQAPVEVRLLLSVALLVLAIGASVAMAPIPASALAYMAPVLLSVLGFVALDDPTPLYSQTFLNVFVSFACLSFLRQGWLSFRRSVAAKQAADAAAADVRAGQRRLQSIVESLPYPVAIFARAGGTVCYANRRAAELLDLPLERVMEMSAVDFFFDRAEYERLITRLQQSDVVTDLEARLRQAGGGELWTRAAAIVMEYEGEPAVLATLEDVTERRRHELELRAAKDQAEAASRAKSQFLANMSHELRTPLNAVIGYAELMADGVYGPMPERSLGVLQRVQANSKHLLGLINDVLDLSKIEAGQIVLVAEPYALAEMVRTVQSATESLALAKKLEYRASVDAGMPAGRGDVRRMTQVLLNLVGNAIKFTDRGSVEIRASHAGGCFVVEVRDSGPGIDPKDHARIFEEFQQVDNTSTRNKGGSGLGLAISRRILALHGGALELESEPGRGALFRATWPVEAPLPSGS